MKALISFALFLPCLAFADVSVPRSKQYAEFSYDVSAAGGQSAPHSIGMSLPQGAIITDMYVYINTVFSSSGPNSSVAISCSGTRDLMDWQGLSGVAVDSMFAARLSNGTFSGSGPELPINAVALNLRQGYMSIPSACGVVVNVNSSSGYTPLSAGKLTGVIEYFKR